VEDEGSVATGLRRALTAAGYRVDVATDGGVDALGADGSITEADCADQHGYFAKEIGVSLLHVWTVPSFASAVGVFSHANPAVTWPDGSYHGDEPACAGK
jgi:hypothetical protein